MARRHYAATSTFALTATVDLLLGFILLAVVAAFAAIASTSHAPPRPQPPPDTAAFVAFRVHAALKTQYPDIALDTLTATVRLPGMFPKGKAYLRSETCRHGASEAGSGCVMRATGGAESWVPASTFVSDLADVLLVELPYFSLESSASEGRSACEQHHGRPCPGRLTTVFIEGHADRSAYDQGEGASSNSKLSLDRALAVFEGLESRQPDLTTLESGPADRPQQLIAAAGFGCRRPAFNTVTEPNMVPFKIDQQKRDERCPKNGDSSDETEEAKNRRVELRFVVSLTPSQGT